MTQEVLCSPLAHLCLCVSVQFRTLVSLDLARASSLTYLRHGDLSAVCGEANGSGKVRRAAYAMMSTSLVSACCTQHGTTELSVAATLLSFS